MTRVLSTLLLVAALSPLALAQTTTAFSHQGVLEDGGAPANGSYDFRFQLFDAATSGTQVGSDVDQTLAVTDGEFATSLDFGSVFGGTDLWLAVGVRPGGSSDSYSTLGRTQLLPVPYAAGLGLPFDGSASTVASAPLLSMEQTGDGTAARFAINNSLNASTVVHLETDGNGALLHAQAADLGLDGSQQNENEDITVESSDSFVGLYSSGGGGWGSGLDLGEVSAGTLSDKWTMVRRTVAGGSELYFLHGTDPSFVNNTTKMILRSEGALWLTGNSSLGAPNLRILEEDASDFARFSLYNSSNSNFWDVAAGGTDNDRFNIFRNGSGDLLTVRGVSGNVGINETEPQERLHVDGNARADALIYNAPRTHYLSLPSEAFHPVSDVGYRNGGSSGVAYINSGFDNLASPVLLPHGAVVTRMTGYFNDNSASDMEVRLQRKTHANINYDGAMAFVSSSGISGLGSAEDSTVASATVDNATYGYAVLVFSSAWDTSLQLRSVVIEYTVSEAQ